MEEYRIITGFENYSISNLGNVKNNTTGKQIKSRFDKYGYLRIELRNNSKRKTFFIHRLVALCFIPNPENKPIIDHIDNNKLNNNFENLRWCEHYQNSSNLPIPKNNTSGFKGVSLDKSSNKWRAEIISKNSRICLGYYATKEEAIEARVLKAFELFGEFMNECEKIQYDIILSNKQKEQQTK